MDRYSKWPAARLCKSTDGTTAVIFLQQYVQLDRIPTTMRTDKASAFTFHHFRQFCKKSFISILYGTPYIQTPTGLVKRGARTLKENLLTNVKAEESFGKVLDIASGAMRSTPHARLKNSAYELHFGSEPNTELSNMLKLNEIKKTNILPHLFSKTRNLTGLHIQWRRR